jgi:hypothetical protein
MQAQTGSWLARSWCSGIVAETGQGYQLSKRINHMGG